MSRFVMGIDAATDVAIAFYDIDRGPEKITTFHMKTEGTIVEKLHQCRQHLPPEVKPYAPLFALIEGPLQFVPTIMAEKNTKRRGWARGDLMRGAGEGAAPIKTPMVNITSVQQIAQMAGGLTMMCFGLGIEAEQIQPKEWQKHIPQVYRDLSKDKKVGVKAYCNALRILNATNEHARDAAIIAVVAANRYREMLLTRGEPKFKSATPEEQYTPPPPENWQQFEADAVVEGRTAYDAAVPGQVAYDEEGFGAA